MLIKVIYADGSTGLLRTSRLARLIKLNRIAAYQAFDRWVEVRRKQVKPELPRSGKKNRKSILNSP